MPAPKSRPDPAAELLEDVLSRKLYSSETHQAVTQFLCSFAAEETRILEIKITLLQREIATLKKQRRQVNDC